MTQTDKLLEALEPFAVLADAILSEAPADAEFWHAFTDSEGNRHTLSMDELRATQIATTPSATAPTAATPADARAVVEACAAIADQYAENSGWSWSPRKAPEAIAAAIRAKASEIIAALPKAGEVEPVACQYGHNNGDGTYSPTYERWPLPAHIKPHPDWPIKYFYATPPSVIPAAAVPHECPTAKGDRVASLMREYFEQHKRDKWDGFSADNLMLGLQQIVQREYTSPAPAAAVGEGRQFAYLHDTVEFAHPLHGHGHFFTPDCIKEMPLLLPTPSEGLTERYRAAFSRIIEECEAGCWSNAADIARQQITSTPEKDA